MGFYILNVVKLRPCASFVTGADRPGIDAGLDASGVGHHCRPGWAAAAGSAGYFVHQTNHTKNNNNNIIAAGGRLIRF